MDKISGYKSYVLGLQHMFAMFGATVLVPVLTGLRPSVALFAAGIGTLLFHFLTKYKVPVFMGSSFAFIGGIKIVVESKGIGEAGGGIIAAGCLYLLMAAFIYFVGVERVRSFVPPVVTGPIIMVIGLTLSPVAVGNITGFGSFTGRPLMINWIIAVIVLLTVIGTMIFVKGFFKLVPILIGIIVGYLVSIGVDALGIAGTYIVENNGIKEEVAHVLVNTKLITDANWLSFGEIFKGQFFTFPKFDWSAIALIAPIALVTFMEHIGDITTNGAVVKKDFFKDPGLHRTLMGDGIATMAAGLIGGPANTTYSENTGVLAVTKVYDPSVLRIAAVFAIVLSMFGKFGAVLNTIPAPVMGGVSMILFGIIASIGLRTIAEAKLDFAHSRNLVVVALVLVIGLGVGQIQITDTFSLSGLFLAALVGIIANKVLPQEL